MKSKFTHPPTAPAPPVFSSSGNRFSLFRSFLVFCVLFLASFSKQAHAVLVTIGTNYTTSSTWAMYTYQKYSTSEQTYSAAEIGTIGMITSFAINKSSGSTSKIDSVYLYMKEGGSYPVTTGTAHSLAGYTLVYKGDFTNSASSGWMGVTLTTPFSYTGSSNLSVLIVRHNGTAITSSTPNYWGSGYDVSKMAINYHYSNSDLWTGWASSSATYGSTPYFQNGYRNNIQINIDPFPACTATPAAGTAVASTTTACPGVPVKFSLIGSTLASSISYEWDTSSTGTGGWALLGSSTTVPGIYTFTPPVGRTLYYRCRSVCSGAGGTSVTSTTVSVSVSPFRDPPYTEDFESGTMGVNMPCANALPAFDAVGHIAMTSNSWWRILDGAGGIYVTGNASARSGTKYLWSGYSNSTYTTSSAGYWFTPGLNLKTGKTYRFAYWYRTTEYHTTNGIGTDFGMYFGKSNTSTSGLTSITPELMGKKGNSYAKYSGDFTVSSDGVYYCAVKTNNFNWAYYGGGVVDDISLEELPPCNTATASTFGAGGKALASPNVICNVPGTTSLSVSGTPAYSGLDFSWEVASGSPTSFASAGITTASGSYSITTGGTYYFRCKVNCTATGLFAYSDTVKVLTTPITPPYTEDFESGTPGKNMPCAATTGGWSDVTWNLFGAPFGSAAPGLINRTPGGSNYLRTSYNLGAYASRGFDYWFTPGLALTAAKAYDFTLWFSPNGYYPSSYPYNTALGIRAGTAQTAAAMTIEAGTDTTIRTNDIGPYRKFTRGFICPTTGTYYVGIALSPSDYTYPAGIAIDDIGLEQLPSCAAKPAAGTTVANPSMICSTGTVTLSLKGLSLASDLSFQWYQSDASGALVTLIPGATGVTYTTPTITTGPVYYRCVVTCNAIAAPNSDMSSLVQVNVGPITPPYIETFESGTVGKNQPCASNTNTFESTGRTSYYYYWGLKDMPGTGSYSGSVKNRTPGGNKYLSAGYMLSSSAIGASSDQQYWFSPPLRLKGGGMAYNFSYWYVNNGDTYMPGTTYGLYYGTAQTVAAMRPIIPDLINETNTSYKQLQGVLRPGADGVYYMGIKVNIQYGYSGIAMDDIGVEELPICSAKPVAGKIASDPIRICSSGTAVLSLSGTSAASMLNFEWFESSTPVGGFSSVGSGVTYTTSSLTATKYYYAVVTCGSIGAPNKDTTPVYKLNVGPLDPPYLEDFESNTPGKNVACASFSGTWDPLSAYVYWGTRGSDWAASSGYFVLTNHTPGGKGFLLSGYNVGRSTDDYWFTPGIRLKKDSTYQFSYWFLGAQYLYGSTATNFGMAFGTTQTKAGMTTVIAPDLIGQNTDVYKQYAGRFIAPTTNVYYMGVKVRNPVYTAYYGLAIDDIGLEQLEPCSGKPVAGKVSITPNMMCTAGGTATMSMDLTSTTKAAGLTYTWERSTDPTFPAATTVAGPTTSSTTFTSPALTETIYFRCIVTCKHTGDTTRSSVMKVDVGVVIPPYFEDFEKGSYNVNMPCAGATAFSTGYTWGLFDRPYSTSYPAIVNHTPGGNKYLHAGYGLSTAYGYPNGFWFTPAIKFTGGKLYQLSFWYSGAISAVSSTTLGVYYGNAQTAAAMTTAIAPDMVPVSTPLYKQYVRKFTPAASGNYYIGIKIDHGSIYMGDGMAVDDINLQEVPPCSATVVAGTIESDPVHICSVGSTASLDLKGSTLATGLTYEWFTATSEAGPYTSTGTLGSSLPYTTDPLSVSTWYRAIVKCTATGATDTSKPYKVSVGGYEIPYTEDFESTATGQKPICSESTEGWGYDQYFWNLMDRGISPAGNHTPGGKKYLLAGYYLGLGYTWSPYYMTVTDQNFWFTPGLTLDSRYKYELSFWYVTASAGNKMGVFYGRSQSVGGMTNTLFPLKTINNSTYEKFDTTFKPAASGIYYIGLQKTCVALYTSNSPGIAFDDINLNYAPCDGMPNAGNIRSTMAPGTAFCSGTYVRLVDTGATFGRVPGIKFQWQRRSLGASGPLSWTAIPGATDTVLQGDTLVGFEYRFAAVCGNTNDTAFTSSFRVPALPAHPAVSIAPSASPINYCIGDTVKLGATVFSSAVYDWMIDSTVIPGWKFSDLGATEPGKYMVKVSSPLSPCPAWSKVVILEGNDPGYSVTVTKPTDSILCAGSSLLLTAVASKPGVTYQWRKDNIDIPGATGSNYLVTIGGNYRVLVSDGISTCPAASRVLSITVKPNPPAAISLPGGTATACENDGVLLSASAGGFSYEWMRGGAIMYTWTEREQLVKTSGIYSVKVRSADGCASVSTDIAVNILPSPEPVIVKTVSALGTITLSTTLTTYASWQWMRNGFDIPGAVLPTLTLSLNGLYKVRVTNTNDCEGISTPIEINETSLSINSINGRADQIKIYPNPTQSKVFIQSPIEVRVSVKDVTGKTIVEAQETKEIDLGKFADGVYLFTISDKEGNELIKQQRVTKFTDK